MVTAKAVAPAQRDDDGRWLCNVTASCSKPAVIQSTYACSGCSDYVYEQEQLLKVKRQARADHEKAIEGIRQALELEERPPVAAEAAVIALGHEQLQRLGADIEALTAAAAAHTGEHTHPVFACTAHGRKAGLIAD